MLISLSNTSYLNLESSIDIPALEARVEIEEEKYLISFIQDWLSTKDWFTFQTSGSTGSPKSIQLHRKTLEYSAHQTLKAVNLNAGDSDVSSLLCISPKYIGGIMVFVRAWLTNGKLKVLPAKTDFEALEEQYDLTSIVPLQVEKLLQKRTKVEKLQNVLIGGAPLSQGVEKKLAKHLQNSQNWYATYGMTETASHVALRRIGKSIFEATGDVQFDVDHRGCLKIKGTITDNQSLKTNDMIDLHSSSRFEWKGRYDFIINSGGVMVNPEKVELIISKMLGVNHLVVTWIPDASLGQKVVCLSKEHFELSSLKEDYIHPYEKPKQLAIVDDIPSTLGGKLDRTACQLLAESVLIG